MAGARGVTAVVSGGDPRLAPRIGTRSSGTRRERIGAMDEEGMKQIEPQLLRAWVYEALKGNLPRHTPQLNNVNDVLASVYSRACRDGYLDEGFWVPVSLLGPQLQTSRARFRIPSAK